MSYEPDYRKRHFRSLHKCRDWSGLPGVVSLRDRPMSMKRSDWESLIGRTFPQRLNATIESRRFAFRYQKMWRLVHEGWRGSNRVAYQRFFPEIES